MPKYQPNEKSELELLGTLLKDVIQEAQRQIREPETVLSPEIPMPETIGLEADTQESAAQLLGSLPVTNEPEADSVPLPEQTLTSPEAEFVPSPEHAPDIEHVGAEVVIPPVTQPPTSPDSIQPAKPLREFDPGFGPMVIPSDELPVSKPPVDIFGDTESERLQQEAKVPDDYGEPVEKPGQGLIDANDSLVDRMVNILSELTRRANNNGQRVMQIESSCYREQC